MTERTPDMPRLDLRFRGVFELAMPGDAFDIVERLTMERIA
jgi:hypothetical protein